MDLQTFKKAEEIVKQIEKLEEVLYYLEGETYSNHRLKLEFNKTELDETFPNIIYLPGDLIEPIKELIKGKMNKLKLTLSQL